MRQDLNLSFVDILGYLLPGTIAAWIFFKRLDISIDPDWIYYSFLAAVGYLMGHLFLMFHFVSIRRFSKWIIGDPRVSLKLEKNQSSENVWIRLKNIVFLIQYRFQKNIRYLIGLPPLSKSFEKKYGASKCGQSYQKVLKAKN